MACPMECHCLPAVDLPHTTPLYASYVQDFASVERFYAHAPTVEQVSRLAGQVTLDPLLRRRRDGGFARPEPGVWRRQGGRGQPGSLGGRGGGDRYGPAGRAIFGSQLHDLQGCYGAAAGRGFDGCGNSGRGDFLAGGRGPRSGRGESLLLADARGACAAGASRRRELPTVAWGMFRSAKAVTALVERAAGMMEGPARNRDFAGACGMLSPGRNL